MLAGVLLHVVEAAGPVNATLHFSGIEYLVDNVDDFISIVTYVENVGVAKLADVVWLPAGSGVESGAIENDFPGRGLASGDPMINAGSQASTLAVNSFSKESS
jgi:hypothetical protein